METVGEVLKDEEGYLWYIRNDSEVEDCVQDMVAADIDHEKNFLNTFINLSSKYERFIDIGAHVGYYSIRLANRFKIIDAFEPSEYNTFGLLVNSTLNNIKNISIYKCAVGSKNDKGILLERGAVSCMDRMKNEYAIEDDTIMSEIFVEVRTLDALYPEVFSIPTIVKIDTEGMELDILEGGKNFFKNNKLMVVVEHHEDKLEGSKQEIIDFFEKINYELTFSDEEKLMVTNEKEDK